MECIKLISVRHGDAVHKVPCGKCAYCLTNRRSQWMFRIHHEIRLQEKPGYFLTLTYDEKHVPRAADGRLSLRFYDIQLYIKRLRKAKYYVKYICVGEYGSATARPHYHMLVWTDAPTDFLQSNWKSSKDGSVFGAIHFGLITIQSAMYCLKYIIQPKQKADDSGIERTRAQFSHGLGIGYLTCGVYDFHTFDYDNPEMFSYIDGNKVALPRYYKSKIFTKHQMRVQKEKYAEDLIKQRGERFRKVMAQGVIPVNRKSLASRMEALKKYRAYVTALRAENAQRIINGTKHGESL